MSQYQKSFPALISSQLNYVITLANNLKKHILLATNKRKSDLMFLKMFRIMYGHLQSVICEDHGEEGDWCGLVWGEGGEWNKKSFGEIVGHGQFEAVQENQECQSKCSVKCQDNPINFRDESLNMMALVRGPYRSYSMQDKLKVIKLYKEGRSYALISRFLQIPQKNIVRWCKNGVHRKQGAGRKIGDVVMQKNILKWIYQNFNLGSEIKSKQIHKKAIHFSTKNEFKSSKGWFKNFIRRHQLNEKYDIK